MKNQILFKRWCSLRERLKFNEAQRQVLSELGVPWAAIEMLIAAGNLVEEAIQIVEREEKKDA